MEFMRQDDHYQEDDGRKEHLLQPYPLGKKTFMETGVPHDLPR